MRLRLLMVLPVLIEMAMLFRAYRKLAQYHREMAAMRHLVQENVKATLVATKLDRETILEHGKHNRPLTISALHKTIAGLDVS